MIVRKMYVLTFISTSVYRYEAKTSAVMIFLTTAVWTFGAIIFWYPNNDNFQLSFALTNGLQVRFKVDMECFRWQFSNSFSP